MGKEVRDLLRVSREIEEKRIWETVPRRSTIFNPVVMQNIEFMSLFSVAFGQPRRANRLSLHLWQHQFEISEREATRAKKMNEVASDLTLPFEVRRLAAFQEYAVLENSVYVTPTFSPERAAETRMRYESLRTAEDLLPDTQSISSYIAQLFGEIYGVNPQSLSNATDRYAFAYTALPVTWEEIEPGDRALIWEQIAESILDYYVGLHETVAQRRGMRTWRNLTGEE